MIDEVQTDIMPEQLIPEILAARDAIHSAANGAYSLPDADTESLYKHQCASNMAQEIAEGMTRVLETADADHAPYVRLMLDYALQLQCYHLWALRKTAHAAI